MTETATAWKTAITDLNQREAALYEQWQEIVEARKRLPSERVTDGYEFDGPEGRISLRDLFGDARVLVIYHFMYGRDWEQGCPWCTWNMNQILPHLQLHLPQDDIRFVLCSRADLATLDAWKAAHGWDIPWYSAVGHAFTAAMGALDENGRDFSALNVLVRRDDGMIDRVYFNDGLPPELMMATESAGSFATMVGLAKGEDANNA